MQDFSVLSDDELLRGIESLLGSERQLLARLLGFLIEVEERRLDLRSACSSLFDFCTDKLRMSEGEAFRRIAAARLARRFPVVLELIEQGAVHLSALVLLRDTLTEENHLELLREASGKSKRELQALVAARFPKPDVASKIRKLPEPPATAPAEPPGLTLQAALPSCEPAEKAPAPMATAARSSGGSRVEPLSAARYKVQFTASQELRDKLERAKNLSSHVNPSGDLALVVERAVDLLLAQLEKTRLGKTERPRRARAAKTGAVRRAARREVYERDAERCTFVDETGRRCKARAFLELDHQHARALGGSGDASNLRLLCRAHNRLLAEQTFGREHVEKSIRLRQRKCAEESAERSAQAVDRASQSRAPTAAAGKLAETHTKLLSGLVNVGFKAKEARAALGEVFAGLSSASAPPPIEELMRKALLRLSPDWASRSQPTGAVPLPGS